MLLGVMICADSFLNVMAFLPFRLFHLLLGCFTFVVNRRPLTRPQINDVFNVFVMAACFFGSFSCSLFLSPLSVRPVIPCLMTTVSSSITVRLELVGHEQDVPLYSRAIRTEAIRAL